MYYILDSVYILGSGIKYILYRGITFDILDSEIKYINILDGGINSFQIPGRGIEGLQLFVNFVLMSGMFPFLLQNLNFM
jgi:hypothetical protein